MAELSFSLNWSSLDDNGKFYVFFGILIDFFGEIFFFSLFVLMCVVLTDLEYLEDF